MHPADIKAKLEKAGYTQAALARTVIGKTGRPVTSAAVGIVLRGSGRSAAIARAISQAVSIPAARLWPGRYPEIEAEQRESARAARTHTASRRAHHKEAA